MRLDASAEPAGVGRTLQYDRHQRLSADLPTRGSLHRALPIQADLFRLFRTSDARARFPERPMAHDLAFISLHAVGAVRNRGSGSASEDRGLRIEDGVVKR